MKKTYILLILLLVVSCLVKAQKLTLEYNIGYGTYAMGNLKNFMEESQVELKHVKITDNFPGYIVNQAKIGMEFRQIHHTGLSLDFMNTVGNKAVSDYSGSYNLTFRVKGIRLGAFYRITPYDWLTKRTTPYFQLTGGVVLNKGDLEEKLIIGQSVRQKDGYGLNGLNSFVEPAVGCKINMAGNLALNLSVGYEIDLTKKFKDKNRQYQIAVYPDWSGVRLMGGLIYSIPLIH